MTFKVVRNLLLLSLFVMDFGYSHGSSIDLQKEVDKFCERFASPKKCDNDISLPKRKVAFLTWFSKANVELGDHETVKFDQVIENIGKGYNPATGKFTAPVSGIYSIAVSIMSEPKNSMHLGIMRNTQLMSVLYSHSGTFPQASNTLNFSLKKGDTVWVQRRSGKVLHAHIRGPYNVFSGVLITQM